MVWETCKEWNGRCFIELSTEYLLATIKPQADLRSRRDLPWLFGYWVAKYVTLFSWTAYVLLSFSCFARLRRGGGLSLLDIITTFYLNYKYVQVFLHIWEKKNNSMKTREPMHTKSKTWTRIEPKASPEASLSGEFYFIVSKTATSCRMKWNLYETPTLNGKFYFIVS